MDNTIQNYYAEIPPGYVSRKNVHEYLQTNLPKNILIKELDAACKECCTVEYLVNNNPRLRKCYGLAGIREVLLAFEKTKVEVVGGKWVSRKYPGRLLPTINYTTLTKLITIKS